MVVNLSQYLYKILISDSVPQELLLMVLKIFQGTEMLPFYKTDAFRTAMRQMLSVVLLQVAIRAGTHS